MTIIPAIILFSQKLFSLFFNQRNRQISLNSSWQSHKLDFESTVLLDKLSQQFNSVNNFICYKGQKSCPRQNTMMFVLLLTIGQHGQNFYIWQTYERKKKHWVSPASCHEKCLRFGCGVLDRVFDFYVTLICMMLLCFIHCTLLCLIFYSVVTTEFNE